MGTLSSELLCNIELICNATDVTACVFVMLVMITAALQKWNRNIHHFLSGLILLLSGISCQVLVRALEFAHRTDGGPRPLPEGTIQPDDRSVFDSIQHLISMITEPGNADTIIRVICFIFIVCSIDQFFLQALSVREPYTSKHPYMYRDGILKIAVMVLGIAVYLVTDHDEVLTAMIAAQMMAGLYYTVKDQSFVLRRRPVIISVLLSVLACVMTLALPEMRFIGLALAIMYIFLYIEFHTYVETQLSAREAELAESRIRLMNEQISSHFAFNSLKIIEDMCKTDPDKAGRTINVFSKYLRSNLESITAAGMIPFENELEHTKQYIRLEQLEGSSSFNVKYDIETTDFRVPPLVLEPLAENAIKHGVKECGADTVTISTCVKDGKVMVTVRDNGNANVRPAPGVRSSHRSVAIENIRSRLQMQCGGILDIEHTEYGTAATISIPWDDTGK